MPIAVRTARHAHLRAATIRAVVPVTVGVGVAPRAALSGRRGVDVAVLEEGVLLELELVEDGGDGRTLGDAVGAYL
jgi:hypothetical protein